MTEAISLKVEHIIVGDRARKDLGDIDELAQDIKDLGLLQPIVVDSSYKLIAGERRLRAIEQLGWHRIPARVMSNLDDVVLALKAERAENTCRKEFTVTERDSHWKRIVEMEQPKAAERKGTRTDVQPAGNFPAGSGRAKDKAAEAVGTDRRTLEKADKVISISKDPEQPEEVREVAAAEVDTMDRTGKVDGSHKRTMAALDEHLTKKHPEINIARRRANLAKALYAVTSIPVTYRAENVAEIVDDSDLRSIERARAAINEWADAINAELKSNVTPLKAV